MLAADREVSAGMADETGTLDDATPTGIDAQSAASGSARAKTELARARDIRLGAGQAVLAGLFIGWAAIALKAGLNEALQGETGYILLMAATAATLWSVPTSPTRLTWMPAMPPNSPSWPARATRPFITSSPSVPGGPTAGR